MPRLLRLAALQPPAAQTPAEHEHMVAAGLDLLRQAGEHGADIACLPEYFNVMGLDTAAWRSTVPVKETLLWKETAGIATSYGMNVVLPVLETRSATTYNSALLIDRHGHLVGRYDKTHLTARERDELGVTPGDSYPVFDLDFGRVGVMICYDGHFPEVSRLLALQGADIIFFPSLQRHVTATLLDAQLRSRAVDNCVYIVRASYGYRNDDAWVPGMMVGKSCIVDFEGTILADAGPRVGVCTQTIDLDRARIVERSYGGETGDARDFLRCDRRPETYGGLCG